MMGRQDPLRGVGKRFTRAKDSAMVRRDEVVAFGQNGSDSQAGNSCGSGQAGCNQLSTRDSVTHEGSFLAAAWPVIIARMRFLNPARRTMAMWMTRKSTRATETKK